MRAGAVERGDDPNELPRTYAALINEALEGRPADLTVGIHLCRGNFRSTWFAEGGYEPVAEVLFGELDVDAYFLEYDDERSGDFAPLRFVPADKTVVLGLISSKVADTGDRSTPLHSVSTKRPSTCRSNSCASARNAASAAPCTATTSPRTCSGPSCD